jgi:lysophospholipid acyltransferase (LPLAT)-like uncharacterized protein
MSKTSPLLPLRNSGVALIFARRMTWRRLLRNARLRRAACWAMYRYIRFVYRTNRWTVEGGEAPRRLIAEGRAFIGAFWHGRMMMIPMAWQRMAPMHMLISAHRDGQIIADAVSYFSIQAIAGSTRRGGSAALRNLLKKLKEGDCVAITPDGPRGPAMTVSIGIVNAARLAQVPIVPITYATSRRWMFPSWDHFHVALPFGRGLFLWGQPIEIATELDEAGLEHARSLIEARMIEMVDEADRRVGHGVRALQPPDARLSSSPRAGGIGQGKAPSPRQAVQPEKPR